MGKSLHLSIKKEVLLYESHTKKPYHRLEVDSGKVLTLIKYDFHFEVLCRIPLVLCQYKACYWPRGAVHQ